MSSEIGHKRALILYGGSSEHKPDRAANFVATQILGEFQILKSNDLGVLCVDKLREFDLFVPIWMFGELSVSQESDLLAAVGAGLGVLAWHGAASAFLGSRPYKFMLGGQFVGHPGGGDAHYTVKFLDNDPLVEGLGEIVVTSEQYYLLVDPAVKILATTRIHGADMNWVAGVEMPVVWTRRWNRGRVFYCSLGHSPDVLGHATILDLLRRAARWASRGGQD